MSHRGSITHSTRITVIPQTGDTDKSVQSEDCFILHITTLNKVTNHITWIGDEYSTRYIYSWQFQSQPCNHLHIQNFMQNMCIGRASYQDSEVFNQKTLSQSSFRVKIPLQNVAHLLQNPIISSKEGQKSQIYTPLIENVRRISLISDSGDI